MSREEVDVSAIKNIIPDMRGVHLWIFLQLFGVPSSQGIYYGKNYGYESYEWTGGGGKVEYYFNSHNICVANDIFEWDKLFKG